MEIDRKLQHSLLLELKQAYPKGLIIDYLYFKCVEEQTPPVDTFEQMMALLKMPKDATTFRHLKANLAYLVEHQLIANVTENGISMIKATAKGVDFMENDGGLSAIFNHQTISVDKQSIEHMAHVLAQLDKPAFEDFLFQLSTQLPTCLIQKLLEKLPTSN